MRTERGIPAKNPFPVPAPHSVASPSPKPECARRVQIVVPTCNERAAIPEIVRSLSALGSGLSPLFVDGGSTDGTKRWLEEHGQAVIGAERGRGAQLAAGACHALTRPGATILWFVHADCRPQADALTRICDAVDAGAVAGACTLRFTGGWAARFMTRFYAVLNRCGLYYGDATLFVRADVYEACGGYGPQPLFEDVDLVRRLRRGYPGGFRRIPVEVVASSRRFDGLRFPLVFALWILLQTLYWCGVPPRLLAKAYRLSR